VNIAVAAERVGMILSVINGLGRFISMLPAHVPMVISLDGKAEP
jgi:hypothetical protein